MKYEGYEIELPIESQPSFRVDFRGEGGKPATLYASYREARTAIDAHRVAFAKAVNLALPVITERNELRSITGINLHDGSLTGIGKDARDAWPDVPWIVERMQEVANLWTESEKLRRRRERLLDSLRPYQVRTGYHSRHVIDHYADMVRTVQESYAHAKARALEEGPPEVAS